MKKIILWIVLLFVMTNLSFADDQKLDRKQVYELQEQCEKQSEDFFRQKYPSSSWKEKDGATWIVDFYNHYNKKLNQCFIVITSKASGKNIEGKEYKLKNKEFYEVNEHDPYGLYIQQNDSAPAYCRVFIKTCNTEQQWYQLAAPYMVE